MRTWPNQLITPAAWHNCRLLPGSGGDQNRAEHRRQQRRSAIETSSYLLLESRERVANYPIYSKGQVFLGLVAARPRQVFCGYSPPLIQFDGDSLCLSVVLQRCFAILTAL